jgi:hypothetical protein
VVIATDPEAIRAFDPDSRRVRQLLDRGVLALTGQAQLADAWRTFAGSGDVVGIRIVARGGPIASVRKDVVHGIVAGLRAAGVPEANIIVWDKYQSDLRDAGYTISDSTNALRVVGVVPGVGFDPEVTYRFPYAGKLIWGDLQFGAGEDISAHSHLTRIVTRQITKLINVAVLCHHSEVGLSGCLYNLAVGSVDNTRRFQNDAIACESAVPDINALPALRDKAVLHVVDGLLGQYALGPTFHPQSTWHHGAIYLSADPVALDAVALDEIESQRRRVGLPSIAARARYLPAAAEDGLGRAKREEIELVEAGAR